MVRRRRKTKYTWLPNVGQAPDSSDTWVGTSFLELVVEQVEPGDPSPLSFIPLFRDSPPERNQQATDTHVQSMADIIGSEYFLRRIVGKMYVSNESFTDGVTPTTVRPVLLVKTGIYVARADADNSDFPIAALNEEQLYHPLGLDANREPWIWQRSWILGSRGLVATHADTYIDPLNSRSRSYPVSNTQYGSALEGTHIDIKTARRIRQDERLYWSVGFKALGGFDGEEWTAQVRALFDYRGLGALRRAAQRGAF